MFIARHFDAVYAKIVKIEWVFLVATRELDVAHQTNYDTGLEKRR